MALLDDDLIPVWRPGYGSKSARIEQVKDYIDPSFVDRAGDSMLGDLTTIPPTQDGHAANKKYADDEINKLISDVQDAVTNLGNGSYNYSSSGVVVPGQFTLKNGTSVDPDYADADELTVHHQNIEGENITYADTKVGEFFRFVESLTGENVVYQVNTITHFGQASVFGVTFVKSTQVKPFDGEEFRLSTLHLAGVSLDDILIETDQRYLPLTGGSIEYIEVKDFNASNVIPYDFSSLPHF